MVFTSESGGGTTPPTTKTTTALTTMVKSNAGIDPNARVLLGSTMMSVATIRVAKAKAATVNGKTEDRATQIVVQMRYLTICSVPKSINMRMSKYLENGAM